MKRASYIKKAATLVVLVLLSISGCNSTPQGTSENTETSTTTISEATEKVPEKKPITAITIPTTISRIREGEYDNGLLNSVTIPDSVTSIGIRAFAKNQLTSVQLPDSLTVIDIGTFSDNQLERITLPGALTTIGAQAFQNNKLKSVAIPDSVISIGHNAFTNNQLTSINIPKSLVAMNPRAFAENPLTTVIIPDGIAIKAFDYDGEAMKKLAASYLYFNKKGGVYILKDSVWTLNDKKPELSILRGLNSFDSSTKIKKIDNEEITYDHLSELTIPSGRHSITWGDDTTTITKSANFIPAITYTLARINKDTEIKELAKVELVYEKNLYNTPSPYSNVYDPFWNFVITFNETGRRMGYKVTECHSYIKDKEGNYYVLDNNRSTMYTIFSIDITVPPGGSVRWSTWNSSSKFIDGKKSLEFKIVDDFGNIFWERIEINLLSK